MHHSRYIPHNNTPPEDLSQVREDITNALKAGLRRVRRHPSSKTGVYIGAGGHLLTRWKLADTLPQRDLPTIHADAGTLPLSIPSAASRASFLETAVGTACLVLAQQLRLPTRDSEPAAKCAHAVKVVRAAVAVALGGKEEDAERDEDGCEVLYGRAGLLYALLFLRRAMARRPIGGSDALAPSATLGVGAEADGADLDVGRLVSDGNVAVLVDDVVAWGRIGAAAYARDSEARRCPPLMWSWHGKRYLGGAHGVAGILHVLLCSPAHLIAPHWAAIEGTVDWLLGLQQPSGNWPHKASRAEHDPEDADQLIQWCHGAPGVLVLLATLLRRGTVKDETKQAARSALAKGGKLVYERGLPRKGIGLCHGVAGNVYALLAVSEVLDKNDATRPRIEGEWFRRALQLAHLACSYEELTASGEMGTPDRPYSLYEGAAGMCCAWADVLALLGGTRRRAGMPGFDDLDDV